MPLFVTCVVSSSDDGKLPHGFCKCGLPPTVYMASIHKRRADSFTLPFSQGAAHCTSTMHYITAGAPCAKGKRRVRGSTAGVA